MNHLQIVTPMRSRFRQRQEFYAFRREIVVVQRSSESTGIQILDSCQACKLQRRSLQKNIFRLMRDKFSIMIRLSYKLDQLDRLLSIKPLIYSQPYDKPSMNFDIDNFLVQAYSRQFKELNKSSGKFTTARPQYYFRYIKRNASEHCCTRQLILAEFK